MRKEVLLLSSQRRTEIMAMAQVSETDARDLARRYIFDSAEALCDLRSRNEAATVVYHIADAITCNLPLEDWRAEKPAAAPAPAVAAPTLNPQAKPVKQWFALHWRWPAFWAGYLLATLISGWRT